MNRSWLVLVTYVVALTGYLALGFAYTFYKKNSGEQDISRTEFPKIASLNQLGEFKTVSDYTGKTVLVNFWFSACPACLDEMKYFPPLLEQFPDLVIMSFSIDEPAHTFELVKNKPNPWNFLTGNDPRWTFYHADQNEKNGYIDLLQVQSFPTNFLISMDGKIISSPNNAIFGVEKELGGILSFRISLKRYFDHYDVWDILKALGIFHALYAFFLYLWYNLKK